MKIDTTLADAIESYVRQWLASAHDPEIEDTVRRERVLPIHPMVGGTFFFRAADSQVLVLGWERDAHLEVVEDDMQRVSALVFGARKYPELAKFLPVRPPNAKACDECGGSGEVMKYFGCGACRCLGWRENAV